MQGRSRDLKSMEDFVSGEDLESFLEKNNSQSVSLVGVVEQIGEIRSWDRRVERELRVLVVEGKGVKRIQVVIDGKALSESDVFSKKQICVFRNLDPRKKGKSFYFGTNFMTQLITSESFMALEMNHRDQYLVDEIAKLGSTTVRMLLDVEQKREIDPNKSRRRTNNKRQYEEGDEFGDFRVNYREEIEIFDTDEEEDDDEEEFLVVRRPVDPYAGLQPVRVSKFSDVVGVQKGRPTNLCGKVVSVSSLQVKTKKGPTNLTKIDIRSFENNCGRSCVVNFWDKTKEMLGNIKYNDIVLVQNCTRAKTFNDRVTFNVSASGRGKIEVVNNKINLQHERTSRTPHKPTRDLPTPSFSGSRTIKKKKRGREGKVKESPNKRKKIDYQDLDEDEEFRFF